MFDGSGASEHSAAGPSAAPKSSEVNREGGAGATGQNSGGVGPGERVSDADLKNTAGPYDARAVAPVNHHVLNQAAAGVDDSHEMWDGAAAVIFTVATVVTGPGELIGLGAEGAANAASGARLARALAYEESSAAGVAELLAGGGKVIAGPGARAELRVAGKLASEYGGSAADWVKVTSTGSGPVQIHAYRNVVTGFLTDLKSIIP